MRYKLIKTYLVAILLGIVTGIVGSYFQIAIHQLDKAIALFLSYMQGKGGLLIVYSVLISVILALVAWLLVHYIAPEASGSGVQEIEGALLNKRPIYWRRLLPVKFIGGVLSISAKFVVGREGPTIQMGGNLGAMFGELLGFSKGRKNTLIMAGSAAGLATAFNAPLAAVIFVVEELRQHFHFNFTNFKTVAITCIMATVTLHFILGAHPAIQMNIFELPSLGSLWLFFIFGIVVGFIGLIFNKTLMLSLSLVDKLNVRWQIFYVVAVATLIGALAYYDPDVVGAGYLIIHQALSLNPSLLILCFLVVVRFVMTMLCYGSLVPGGIFAPLLALGALLGTAFFYFLQLFIPHLAVEPGMFAVAGMGALFAASIRAPITGIILVVEMTQNYLLILPLMVTCLTATLVLQLVRDKPIYTQLLKRTLDKEKSQ